MRSPRKASNLSWPSLLIEAPSDHTREMIRRWTEEGKEGGGRKYEGGKKGQREVGEEGEGRVGGKEWGKGRGRVDRNPI